MSLNKLYIRILLLIVFAGPLFYFLFTEDGQRRADRIFLTLFGAAEAEFNLALDALSPGVSEGRLREAFPELPLECTDAPSAFGGRTCHALITSFNGYPARYVAFIFDQRRLTAMKLAYQRSYHRQLVEYLDQRLGERTVDEAQGERFARWAAGEGVVVALDRSQLEKGQEPALMWIGLGTEAGARMR